jgi:hypothetical protein
VSLSALVDVWNGLEQDVAPICSMRFLIHYFETIRETLEPEFTIVGPLCMSQYTRLFGITRGPQHVHGLVRLKGQ